MTTKHYSFEAANGTVTIDVVGEYRDGSKDIAIEFNGEYAELEEIDAYDDVLDWLLAHGAKLANATAVYFAAQYIERAMIDGTADAADIAAMADEKGEGGCAEWAEARGYFDMIDRPHLIAKAENDCYAVALYDTERGGYVEATDPESLAKGDYGLVDDAADACICATPEHEDPEQWRIIAREQAFDQGIILGNWHDGKPGTSDLGYFVVMEVQAQ